MYYSTEHILVSHAGVLPRPPGLKEQLLADFVAPAAQQALSEAVTGVVRRQANMGIDIVNDGEQSKFRGFSEYVRDRLSGISDKKTDRKRLSILARDARDFPGFIGSKFANWGASVGVCEQPLSYIGGEITQTDILNFKTALKGLKVGAYLPSVAPGTIEHWLLNEHYNNEEAFLFAIADAMAHEYKAITDAGLLLQIDDPDLPDGWQMYPDMSVKDYRKYASLRVEALNHALKKVPREMVRLHICWGSNHGPHKHDIPFEDIIDIVLRVKAGCVSFEFANVRHEHEWRVWQNVKLRDGTTIMPGVVGHASDIIEHPQLVSDRLVTFAKIVGRENVIAGTDCGLASRLPHAELVWAKLESLVEGSQLASKELWRKAAKKMPAKKAASAKKKAPKKRAKARR
ncbi:MAG: cobalamin-independent methionine synthase II family protein [Xanthobacteraceae bacterium]